MTQFVSQYKGYAHGVRRGVPEHIGRDGKVKPAIPDLEAAFKHEWLTEEGRILAKSPAIPREEWADPLSSEGGLANPDPLKPPFHGLQINEGDREYPVDARLSMWDSERAQLEMGLTDEDVELCIEKLRESPFNGVHFVEVVPAPTEKPWPGYDDVTEPERILDLATAIDYDLNKVIQYERENQNRPEVMKILVEAEALQSEAIVVNA